jgi:hypothetical protein
MKKDQILDSLGRIDDQVIQKVNEARNAQKQNCSSDAGPHWLPVSLWLSVWH